MLVYYVSFTEFIYSTHEFIYSTLLCPWECEKVLKTKESSWKFIYLPTWVHILKPQCLQTIKPNGPDMVPAGGLTQVSSLWPQLCNHELHGVA